MSSEQYFRCVEATPGGSSAGVNSAGEVVISRRSGAIKLFASFDDATNFITAHLPGGHRNWIVERIR